jgi:hypothetical protein
MRIDRYTRALLTIIAACLVWLSVSHKSLPVASAQEPTHLFTGSEVGYRVDNLRPGQSPTGTLVVQIQRPLV